MAWYGDGFEFPEYVSVGERRARARAAAEKIARKQKRSLAPLPPIDGTKIVRTFWGKAWCDNLESYRDYENRLPRGRSYVRHGAVVDLQILVGKVAALVSGTSIYEVEVKIQSLPPKSWNKLASECTRQIDSLVDLLRGRLPTQVMELVTRKQGGLFPSPKEISFECSCPDWAGMCKHVAAVLYGVGVRLEEKPEMLFELRGVDHNELVGSAADPVPRLADGAKSRKVVKGADLSALFGIELEPSTTKVATAATDGAGDPSRTRADASRPRRAKSAKRADSATASKKVAAPARGTTKAQKETRSPKPR
ncbi:MAG TPA: SWIM zinc finger family protein [Polyangia bacterium]|nr:SWIM zinc finger family protein [Polyangia bacterium]